MSFTSTRCSLSISTEDREIRSLFGCQIHSLIFQNQTQILKKGADIIDLRSSDCKSWIVKKLKGGLYDVVALSARVLELNRKLRTLKPLSLSGSTRLRSK
ncbi:hypothetical protein GDO81_014511 [Engystomops pustulosus]|uniref:Uncharacterized protein n=1 Tax=Engystomops pustulosus TaxID=76066 RepID=A0AAV7BBA5_ENGPU|nr:hypothetical protein GDO81_014511 [Engystomops pustulosus]